MDRTSKKKHLYYRLLFPPTGKALIKDFTVLLFKS